MTHFPKLVRALPAFDGPFDAFKLEAKNCDVLFASYPGGTVIPPHNHETENVGVITQGELILVMDGTETRYRAGDWVSCARESGTCGAIRDRNIGDRILVS